MGKSALAAAYDAAGGNGQQGRLYTLARNLIRARKEREFVKKLREQPDLALALALEYASTYLDRVRPDAAAGDGRVEARPAKHGRRLLANFPPSAERARGIELARASIARSMFDYEIRGEAIGDLTVGRAKSLLALGLQDTKVLHYVLARCGEPAHGGMLLREMVKESVIADALAGAKVEWRP